MSVPPITPAAAGLRVQIVSEAEARLLAALDSSAPAVDAPSAAQAPKPTPTADPVRAAVAQARTETAGRQASLAPFFADLAIVADHPDFPPAVRAAVAQVLALRLAAGAPTAETMRQALAQSGLFLEAKLAVASPQDEPPPDLKAALLTLQRALAAIPRQALPAKAPPSAPPPLREAALAGQSPAGPRLSPDVDAPMAAAHLGGQVEQALARQTLHQLASLPDGGTPAWLFEIPIATPQGTAIAQFEIEADAKPEGADPAARAWRARFSLDVEPLGPVHVHLSLAHGRTTAAVWAERDDGLERLRAGGEALARELSGEVAFHAGAPARPAPAAGRFVDRAS